MTKREAVLKLVRWIDEGEVSASELLDLITSAEQDDEGNQIGLGMLPPLSKKGRYDWEDDSTI